jgi:lincosamide nucleotidyltransferase A/C/D/E
MTAADVVDLVDSLQRAGIDVWLDGGWAVDAALERQTRSHDDLDLVVDLSSIELLQEVLGRHGYALAQGAPPKSFELVDAHGRQVDVHPVVYSEEGDGVYQMDNDERWHYPAAGFGGAGRVLGRQVRCLTPEVQVLCHSGYEPHRESFDDVWALSRRFGICVPDEYRRPRESYPIRKDCHATADSSRA